MFVKVLGVKPLSEHTFDYRHGMSCQGPQGKIAQRVPDALMPERGMLAFLRKPASPRGSLRALKLLTSNIRQNLDICSRA